MKSAQKILEIMVRQSARVKEEKGDVPGFDHAVWFNLGRQMVHTTAICNTASALAGDGNNVLVATTISQEVKRVKRATSTLAHFGHVDLAYLHDLDFLRGIMYAPTTHYDVVLVDCCAALHINWPDEFRRLRCGSMVLVQNGVLRRWS